MDIRISIGIGVMVSISQTMMIDGWSNSMSIGGDWSCMGVGYRSYMVSIRVSICIGMCVYKSSLRCFDSRGRSKDSRICFSFTLLASVPSISSVSSVSIVSTPSSAIVSISRIAIVAAIPGFRAGLSIGCRLTFWLSKSQSDKEEDKNKFHGEAVIESESE